MSNSLWPHGLQQAGLPCPSLSPRLCSQLMSIDLVMLSISSSDAIFSSFPQPFPASGSIPMKRLATSDGQSTRASASGLPMNIQNWFLLGLTGLISLLSKGFSKVFCSTTIQKHQFSNTQPSLWSNSHIHIWLLEKQLWLYGALSAKWCLYFLICWLGLS